MSSYNKITKTDLADGALYEKVNDMVDALNADKIERSQVGIRKGSTAYKVSDKCFCEYHGDFLLECTTAGTSAVGQLDTSGTVTDGATRTDGSVVWTFRSVATKKELNDVKNNSLDKTQITNCLTYIPQDIKLELNNGTLTLKAGSKVYVPNGAGKFDVLTVTADKNITSTNIQGKGIIYLRSDGSYIGMLKKESFSSGLTVPSGTWQVWYDTANNKVRKIEGTEGILVYDCTFPLGVVSVSGANGITSIDQVFNGFGYIGSTVFALPGVKGLIPNGRKADGSLKNIEISLTKVLTRTDVGTNVTDYKIGIYENAQFFNYDSNYIYDDENNLIKTHSGDVRNDLVFATYSTDGSNRITSFNSKNPFHAVDYNDAVLSYGDQDIGGNKNFTGTLTWNGKDVITSAGGVVAGSITLKDTQTALSPSEDTWHMASVPFFDKSGVRVSYMQPKLKSNGTVELNIAASDPTNGAKALVLSSGGTLTWDGKEVITPVGTVIAYAANSAPSGYLICNGSAVSRTTYAALFAKIGTTYGTGNGSTTFNLPNLTDKFIQGSGTAGTSKAAGLPNIYGRIDSVEYYTTESPTSTGCLYNDAGVRNGEGNGIYYCGNLHMDASRSNAIYGASTTVQPPALTMRYYIKY